MKTRIEAGAVMEHVTPHELREHLDKHTTSWFTERARGVGTARFTLEGSVSGGLLTLPASGTPSVGPREGFAWAVHAVHAEGLASGDILKVYRNSVFPTNRVGLLSSTSPDLYYGSRGLILRGGENLIIVGSSLMATDISINGEATEVPDPDIYKVL